MGNKISKSVHRSNYIDELDISYMELKAYPSQVSSLLNITLLNLAGNQIKKLDGVGLDKLVNLVTLDISGNKFSAFPRVILSLTKPKQLNVAFNQIKAIPDDINKLVELRKLNASVHYYRVNRYNYGKSNKYSSNVVLCKSHHYGVFSFKKRLNASEIA
ncbi:hypothetical protein MP638_001076 [Amoeboaphelidium occidentale]|nr:hypothetical protein MP638_001076 [Amoeboaphelidium occidentale]